MPSGEIVKREEQFERVKSFFLSKKSLENIRMALPSHLNEEKMARVVITAFNRTPELLECEPVSVMNAVLEASQLGLMPDSVLGHGYILPFGKKAIFIPGYKGMLDLARRSGEIAWVQARVVYANDDFRYQYGASPDIHHTPARAKGEEPGALVAAYGIAKFKSGEVHFEVMHKDEIEAIRKRSRAKDSGPWVTDYDEMARKTVIRRLCKYLPLNPEYQAVIARDEYAEAGVLEKYLDVDAETGEVIPQASALDMFTQELGGGSATIEDPRTGKQEPLVQPEEPEEPEVPPWEELPPQQAEAPPEPPESPETPPDDGGREEDDQDAERRLGRITKNEDANFVASLYNLREKMRKVQDNDEVNKAFAEQFTFYKVKSPQDIRSRHDREKMLAHLNQLLEKWGATHREPPK